MNSALELSRDLPIDGTKLDMGQRWDKLELSQVLQYQNGCYFFMNICNPKNICQAPACRALFSLTSALLCATPSPTVQYTLGLCKGVSWRNFLMRNLAVYEGPRPLRNGPPHLGYSEYKTTPVRVVQKCCLVTVLRPSETRLPPLHNGLRLSGPSLKKHTTNWEAWG